MTPLEMNPHIRARWAAALRSDDFAQGREYLRKGDEYCCLGVLCALAVADGVPVSVTPPEPDGDDDAVNWWCYDGEVAYLPESVREWAGLADDAGDNPLVTTADGTTSLVNLNDAERYLFTFGQIADAIEGITPGQEATP